MADHTDSENGRPQSAGGSPPATPPAPPPGPGGDPPRRPVSEEQIADLVFNAMSARTELLRRFSEGRRDVDLECDYPQGQVSAQTYQLLFDREPIPARVVECLPKESWQVTPFVYESDDPEEVTPFEQAWDDLGKKLRGVRSWHREERGSPVWEVLQRADVLSRIGTFGVLLLGLSDIGPPERGGKTLSQPVDGVDVLMPASADALPEGEAPVQRRPLSLLFLRAFPQSLVEVSQFETNYSSPRYMKPKMYRITMMDAQHFPSAAGVQTTTHDVHWTRVIHLSDCHHQAGPSEDFNPPVMQSVLNRLLDLKKVYGASSEGYWQNSFAGLSFETHPQLGGEVNVNLPKLRDMAENYRQGLQRELFLIGMSAKTLAPMVVDPSNHIERLIEAICIKLGCPVRIFKGSERGELASTQDDDAWNDRLVERQYNYITPRIIVPFIDRLIACGVLPEPAEGYRVEWPDLTSRSEGERAATANTLTQALALYVSGNLQTVMTLMDYLVRVWQWSEEEAKQVVDGVLFEQSDLDPALPDGTADDGGALDDGDGQGAAGPAPGAEPGVEVAP